MTESIKSDKILEVTYDKGLINLLIKIKCIMVVVLEPDIPFQNTPRSTSLVFCETNFRYSQYKTDAATD